MNAGNYAALALTLLLAFLPSLVQADSINASVDRRDISENETLRLLVRVSPQASQAPDFSLLEQQFDILGRNQSSQYRNFNGQVEAFTEWQLVLAPKSTGKLLIPSFKYGDNYSDAIEITVKPASETTAGLQPDTYMELTANIKTPYVQQQVLVTQTLYTAVALRIEDAPELNVPGARVELLNQSQFQKRVKDKVYSVSELRYALFPQQSGSLEIPIQTFTVTTGGNSWRGYSQPQVKRIRSKAITLEVKPQAKSFSGDNWLPASKLSVEDSLSSPQNWAVGEPITRTLKIHAEGVTAEQIPDLVIPELANIKQYMETPEREQHKNLNGISANITQTLALVPTTAGEYELPAIELHWWDTGEQKEKVARIEAIKVTVAPGAGSTTPPVPGIEQNSPAPVTNSATTSAPAITSNGQTNAGIWPWLSGILALGNLILGLLLWRTRLSRPKAIGQPQVVDNWAALLTQARGVQTYNDLRLCLLALNKLAKKVSGRDAQTLARELGREDLLHHLQQMAWRNTEQEPIDQQGLTQLIEQMRTHTQTTAPHAATDPVPPCYPQ